MVERPLRIRRARRTDFAAVMGLLATAGTPVPAPDRATLHRFRQLVADLGCDLYLATMDERIVGLVHVTYARQLATAPLATLAQLTVDESAGGTRIADTLIAFARGRAHKRACHTLRCGDLGGTRCAPPAGSRPTGTFVDLALGAEG